MRISNRSHVFTANPQNYMDIILSPTYKVQLHANAYALPSIHFQSTLDG